MAVAKVMGASKLTSANTVHHKRVELTKNAIVTATIRSTSLGVSFGTGLSIENALNTFKPDDSAAWDATDFALFAARS